MTRTVLLALFTVFSVTGCISRKVINEPTPTVHPEMAYVQAYTPPSSASLWNQEPQSLFGNRRARNVGDILTVIVQVDENAKMQNSLNRSRSNEDNLNVKALFGLPEWANGVLPGDAKIDPAVQVARNAKANGSGSISRQEKITLRLAAEVIEKLPNGHLVVAGTQRIRVNHETRDLRLQGVVRPDDITRDNTITHDKVASADILYSGHGQMAQTTGPRRGSRFLDILIPF